MAKRKGRTAQILSWAKSTKRRQGGLKCYICEFPEVCKIIEAVIQLRKRGVRTVAKTQLYERLRREFPEWDASFVQLRDHILKHTKGWGGPDAP